MKEYKYENVVLKEVTADGLNELMPLIKEAFESSIKDGLGAIDNSMLPDEAITEMLSVQGAVIYKVFHDEKLVGGTILKINPITHHNTLEMLFISPSQHSKGLGLKIWKSIETMYPNTKV